MRASHFLLYRYVSKEFLSNFLVAFIFFFCIFFINSILLLVQRILLKNIDLGTMLNMVLLQMPQFMLYVFPFASLTASSMVLGDMGSSNELLALRSSGIPARCVYRPLLFFAVILSCVTFFFADVVHPWSSVRYSRRLSELMREMPTFELEPNSVNTVGNIVLSNGESEGNTIYDIVMLSDEPDGQQRTVISDKGVLTLIDPFNYIYSLELSHPDILLTEKDDIESYGLASAERAVFYLDFSEQIPSLTSRSPVNLSTRDLLSSIEEREASNQSSVDKWLQNREAALFSYASVIKDLGRGDAGMEELISGQSSAERALENLGDEMPRSTRVQYYKAELTKKFALSFACFCLTLVTLPLSNLRVKHGKLTGFAVSLLLAVGYWYLLIGCQIQIYNISGPPYFVMMFPDIFILALAIALSYAFRRSR